MEKLLTADNIKNVGLVGVLAIILYMSFSGQLVWKTQYDEAKAQTVQMRTERDKWEKLALDGTRLSELIGRQSGILPPLVVGAVKQEEALSVSERLDLVKKAVGE